MTLQNLLTGFFDNNPHVADSAMHGENIWGYVPYTPKGGQPSEYHASEFEVFAKANGIDQPTCVARYGGEDCGSTYYSIFKFTLGDETVFIKFYGYYASYSGADYHGFDIVSPVTKTVVVYE